MSIEYLRRRVKELEQEKAEAEKALADVLDNIARADAKRAEEPEVRNYHKWNRILGMLEGNLDRAKARVAMLEADLRYKCQKLELAESGFDVPDDDEEDSPAAPPAPAPVETPVPAAPTAQPAPEKDTMSAADRQRDTAGRALLAKAMKEGLGTLSLQDLDALLDFYPICAAGGPAMQGLRRDLDVVFRGVSDRYQRVVEKWRRIKQG